MTGISLSDLKVSMFKVIQTVPGPSRFHPTESGASARPATVADLVSVLRAEGFIVVGKDENHGWPKGVVEVLAHLRITDTASFRQQMRWNLDALLEAQSLSVEGEDQ